MSSSVFSATRTVILSNHRFSALIEFAVVVGSSKAVNADEAMFVAQLESEISAMHPGFDLSVEDSFPLDTQRTFWRRVFLEVAERIRLGSLGSMDSPNEWRAKAAEDAEAIANALTT